MRRKIKILLVAFFCVSLFSVEVFINQNAYAVPCNPTTDLNCTSCSSQGCDTGTTAPVQKKTDAIGNGCPNLTVRQCLQNKPLYNDINQIVNVLSGLVGVVVVGVIILGGVQYAMAGDKAEAVTAAKKRIINGLIALAAFLLTYAFLQWLIPGGVFS